MERHAPTKRPPRESKLFSLPRIVTTLAVIVLIVLVGRWIWPSGSTAPSLQRTARTYDASAPTSGYSGHASNTHLLSPNWASGIETAWRLSLNAEDKNATVFLYAEGSTLYVTFQSILGPSRPIPRRRMTCPAPSLACCGMRRNRSPRTSTRPHSSSPTRTSCSIPSSFTRQPGGCPTPRGRT